MSASARKVVAEISLTTENRERVAVGARTLYHYWPLLQAYYRGAFLAPQRRTDGNRVGFQWIQEDGASLPSADELKKLRRRVSDAHRDLVEAWSDGVPGGSLSADEAELLRSRLGRVVANLVSLPDREFLGFVATTSDGLSVHSWGAETPGSLVYPDEQVLAIRGRIRQGDAPVAGASVSLEDEEGRALEQTRADTSGFYGFYKLKPGRYRVKATSPRATFAAEGVGVDLGRVSEEQVDLVAEDPAPKVDVLDQTEAPRRRLEVKRERGASWRGRWGVGVAAVVLLLALVAGWWSRGRPPASAVEATTSAPPTRVSGSSIQDRTVEAGPLAPVRQSRSKDVSRADEETPLRRTHARRPVSVSDNAVYESFEPGDPRAGAASVGELPEARGPSPESGLPDSDDGAGADAGAPINSAAEAGPLGEVDPSSSGGAAGNDTAAPNTPGAPGDASEAKSGESSRSPSGTPKTKTGTKKPSPPPRESKKATTPAPRTDPSGVAKPGETAAKSSHSPRPSTSAPGEKAQAETASPNVSPAETKATGPSTGPLAPTDEAEPVLPSPTPSPMESAVGSASVKEIPEPWERWMPPWRAQLGRWQVRLFADAIVPTEPHELGHTVDFKEVREAAWRQRQVQRPTWLRQPRFLAGLKFHPPLAPAGGTWRWAERVERGGLRLEAKGARPWLAWYGGAPSEGGQFTLLDATGAAWVRVRVAASGEVSWQTREGVRVSYWMAAEGDDSQIWTAWRWRHEDGASLPLSWSVDDWAGGLGQRLEVPLTEETLARGRLSIRFMDTNTQWGLGGEFSVSDGRPPVKP